MNYDRFLNDVGRTRKPTILRELAKKMIRNPVPVISMAAGFPNAALFPIKTASFQISDGSTLVLDESSMKTCLQYGESTGVSALVVWLEKIQKEFHNPPLVSPHISPEDPRKMDILITNGSQEGLSKVCESLVSRGDGVLTERACYPGCLAMLRPLGAKLMCVESDVDGMIPDDLERILSKWSPSDAKKLDSDIPKLIYIVPTGGNPTGRNVSSERKEKIYNLARKYDLLIIEDDPYFHLNFTKSKPATFLSMDTDGRVIRLDSFSKIVSPGVRLGFVSGPKAIVNVLLFHTQASVVHCGHLAQLFILRLLEHWGMDGLKQHLQEVCRFYENKRNQCVKAAETHLKGLAEWSVPSGGFFMWIKLHHVDDSYKMIIDTALPRGVYFVPGTGFEPIDGTPSPYIRVSFSGPTEEEMHTAFACLADIIREETGCV